MQRAREIVRKSSISFVLLFCCYILFTVSLRSSRRKSILSADDAMASTDYFAGMDEPSAGGSRLHLQDFHRVAVKNGRPVWEVKASDAEYYSKEGVTHLNDAHLTIHQDKGSAVHLDAKSAKLISNEGTLARAELVGDIVVQMEKGIVLETDLALYYVLKGEISAPEHVVVRGQGYTVEGDELTADLEQQVVRLSKNVVSVFRQGAKIPDGGLFMGGGK